MRTDKITILCIATMVAACEARAQLHVPRNNRPDANSIPVYAISFQRQEPIRGLYSPAIRLPFQCTSDGTIFIGMIKPPDASKELVASLSPSRDSHIFPLDEVQDLYDKEEIDHYASDSQVVFLVRAAREHKMVHGSVVTASTIEEETRNVAERDSYIVSFDRQGKYKGTIRLENTFHADRIGVFASGMFLAYGWDELERRPTLALLKDDGSILELLSPPKGSMPDSAFNKGGNEKGPAVFVQPSQFMRHGHSIIVVWMRTDLPLLEVEESGALRVIRPNLSSDENIEMLIPSDDNIYARVGERTQASLDGKETEADASIYEISPHTGQTLSRFQVDSGAGGANIACVHNDKFLSLETKDSAMVPLVGTREPMSTNATGRASSASQIP